MWRGYSRSDDRPGGTWFGTVGELGPHNGGHRELGASCAVVWASIEWAALEIGSLANVNWGDCGGDL